MAEQEITAQGLPERQPLEQPRCAFHPNGTGERCENQAIFILVSPENASFWYFPCCSECLAEASELNSNHILAHLFGYGDEDADD